MGGDDEARRRLYPYSKIWQISSQQTAYNGNAIGSRDRKTDKTGSSSLPTHRCLWKE
jgi:hypothetical protein